MSKDKVRPMVDKDLRDEIVGFLGGAGSFNEALRWHTKGCKQLFARNRRLAELTNSLTCEVKGLKKANAELSTKLDGTDKAYKSLFELYMGKRGSKLTYLRWGVVFGLVTGLTIGYLFL